MRRIILAIILILVLSIDISSQTTINPGVPVTSFNNAAVAISTGTAYSLPQGNTLTITWQSSFGVAPASITILLEGSLDNSAWNTLDTSIAVAGEIRTIQYTAVRFVRARIAASSGGSGITVRINVLRFSSATTGIISPSSIRAGNGSLTAPSYGFASDTDTGVYLGGADQINLAAGGAISAIFGTGSVTFNNIFFGTSTQDVLLSRDAANTLALRNVTNPQTFRIYNTDSGANDEFTNLIWSGNDFIIGPTRTGTGTFRNLNFQTNDTIRWQVDTAGRFLGFAALGGLGYSTGAGGAVTQATSKATGVTLNTVTGTITMNAAALAADTTVSFTFTNSAIAANDCLSINHTSAGTLGSYLVTYTPAAGSATIFVRNITAGSLSEAIVLKYAVIKCAVS